MHALRNLLAQPEYICCFNVIIEMNDYAWGLFVYSELFLPCLCCRLVKTGENAVAVELRCLFASAQSVSISQVSIRILTTVKNVEYVGKS